MNRRLLPILAIALLAVVACSKKEANEAAEPGATFTVYPGAKYLPEMTDLFKRASIATRPGQPVPPQVIYDTDAALETVAEFYAKEKGIPKVWPDNSANFSTVPPPAYYLKGDHAADFKGIEPVLKQLNINADPAKAVGQYRGAHIGGGNPRVSLTRPYFDPIRQEVVDRTLIVMVRE